MNLGLLRGTFLQNRNPVGPICNQTMIVYGVEHNADLWHATIVDIDGIQMNLETTIIGVDAPSENILIGNHFKNN